MIEIDEQNQINQSQLLYYGALVTQLPNIILALDLVSDDISELESIEPQTKVMLDLALTNLSKLSTEHTKYFNDLEQVYQKQKKRTTRRVRATKKA